MLEFYIVAGGPMLAALIVIETLRLKRWLRSGLRARAARRHIIDRTPAENDAWQRAYFG